MVIYDLVCKSGHQFEGWFRNKEELVSQQESKILTCPFCGTESVTKKLTASKVTRKSNSSKVDVKQPENQSVQTAANIETANSYAVDLKAKAEQLDNVASKEQYEQLQEVLGKVHDYVDNNFEDVGNRFAEEALSIHNGDKPANNIRGTVSKSELKELADEGVSALPLPAKPVLKKDLN